MAPTLRWIAAALGACFVGLIAVIALQQRELSRLRSAVSGQAAALEDDRGRLDQLAQSLASAQADGAAAAGALRQASLQNVRLTAALGIGAADARFWRGERLQAAARRYGASLSRLSLNGDRREALLGLLADRDDAARDAREIALQDGIPAQSPDFDYAVQEATSDVDRDIRSLLGAADFGVFENGYAVPAAYAPAPTVVQVVVAPQPAAPPPEDSYGPVAQPTYYYPAYVPALVFATYRGPGFAGVNRPPGAATRRGEPERAVEPVRAPLLPIGRGTPSRATENSFR